ncbi:MAG: hypothetical protein IJV88_05750 [Ruminococcus sp.]|nr:hypothetical protein [Ruminococcus sp.]
MNAKKTIAILLCAAALCTATFAGCGGQNGATPDEAAVTLSTKSQGQGDNINTKTNDAVTEAASQNSNSDSSVKPTSGYDKTDKNTSGQQGGSHGLPDKTAPTTREDYLVDNVNGAPGSSSAKRCTITVGDTGYPKDVGDTVTYTYLLKTPKSIENVQAVLTYDGSMLKLKEAEATDTFPVLGYSTVYNTAISNTIKFNASAISGFDFTKESALITLEFEVIGTGGCSIATAVEIMDEVGGAEYVTDYVFDSRVTHTETLE